jgi:putative oxidoreductase
MTSSKLNDMLSVRGHPVLAFYLSYLQAVVLLLLRLAWGWESAQSGWGHLHDVAGTAEFFSKLHIPFPLLNVYIAGGTELVGGALLIAGLGTRLAAIPFAFNFLVAIATAGGPKIVEKFHDSFLDGWTRIVDDTAFPFLMLGLVVLAFGPGKLSIDYLIGRFVFGIREPNRRLGQGFSVLPAKDR